VRAAAALGVLALLAAAPATGGDGAWVSAGGGLGLVPPEWTASSSWALHGEDAFVRASHDAGRGPALAVALGYRFARRLGIATAVSLSRREGRAEVEASLPHPLYLDRPRPARGTADGLEYRHVAVHLDLEVRPVAGRLELTLFGGPALARVEADLVGRVLVTEEYPYDEAAFRAAEAAPARS
jgi:hypothetical protein